MVGEVNTVAALVPLVIQRRAGFNIITYIRDMYAEMVLAVLFGE